jgi:hypothetical protein
MHRREDVTEGMVVRSLEGKKLGSVVLCDETQFQIEKGIFFPSEYLAGYDEISEVRDGEVILRHGVEALQAKKPDELEAPVEKEEWSGEEEDTERRSA